MGSKKPKMCHVKEIKKFCDKVGKDSKKCESRKERCEKN